MSRSRKVEMSAREVRVLLRGIKELRAVLGEFLDVEEDTVLGSYWPHGDHPACGPHLCKVLADEMLYGEERANTRDDLRRIKRARRALGLPAWWDKP